MFNAIDRPGAPASASIAAQFEPAQTGAPPAIYADADRIGLSLLNPLQQYPVSQSLLGGLPFGSLIQQLLGAFNQLLASIGSLLGTQQPSMQPQYTDATASSTGDPHLAFDGTKAGGQHASAHYDSMSGHGDLLHSRSFAGGYRISTAVTAPQSNGVTFNQSATVTTAFGDTSVTLDKSGNATILSNGAALSIANGQVLDLGNGETVARNGDGSLTVEDRSSTGGSIATTLRSNGQGVDVNVRAHDVDLGGDLVGAAAPDFYRNLT